MKLQNLLCVMCVLMALPMLANAEIYKWKDKDGTVRYTDTPPPSNIKQESIGGKKLTKPTGQAPLAPVVNIDATTGKDEMKGKVPHQNIEGPDEIAAKLRQKNAETDKNNKKEKEAQAKLKEENCKASKANLACASFSFLLFFSVSAFFWRNFAAISSGPSIFW